MRRRTFVFGLASTLTGIALAGCSGTNENSLGTASDAGNVSSLPERTGGAVATDGDSAADGSSDEASDDGGDDVEPNPITVEGDGSTITDAFDLIGGFVAVDMEYVGYDGGRFRVQLIDEESGDSVRKLADEPDQWSGEIGETLDAGSYRLNIEADGEWSIEIRQPRPSDGDELPVEDNCKTSTVLGPYELDGELQVTATHEGGGNIIVRAHDATADGDEVGNLLIHESGRFDGTETFSHDGLTWITIVSEGDWTVAIE